QSPPIQRAIFPSAPALEDHQQSRHWLQDRLEALPDQVPDHPQVPVQRQSEAIRLEVASRHLQSSAKILDPEPEREMCILQSDEMKNLPLYMQARRAMPDRHDRDELCLERGNMESQRAERLPPGEGGTLLSSAGISQFDRTAYPTQPLLEFDARFRRT